MKKFLKRVVESNKYLSALHRLRKGQTPVYIEYDIDFVPRWQNDVGNPHLANVIAAQEETYRRNLLDLAAFEPVIRSQMAGEFPFSIDWRNPHMPMLDGLTLMWAADRAKSLLIEIGSGNSTMFAKSALLHSGKDTKIVSIDPQPVRRLMRSATRLFARPSRILMCRCSTVWKPVIHCSSTIRTDPS